MKKNVFLWSLYDFANSIIMIVFLFYFSQWLVVDQGKPDWWYNASLVLSSLFFIFTAPIVAERLDATKKKLVGVRLFSLLMVVFYLLTALITLFAPTLSFLATSCFTLALYCYLMSFVYYTPMITDVSTEKNRGWISGLGMGANSLGQVFGLLATLPFATGAIMTIGASGRAQTLLPAILLFVIFSAPLLLVYKEPVATNPPPRFNILSEYAKFFSILKKVFSIKNFLLFFIAYLLFTDALLTFSNNFPIFLEKVFAATDDVKTYLTAGILTLSGVGSIFFGKVSDKIGTKRTLFGLLTFWAVFFPVLAYAPSLGFAGAVCLLAGLFFGPVWGVSRAMVTQVAPKDAEARSFAFYTLAERFATFLGPIVWSTILAATANGDSLGYSYALVGMGGLVIIGLFFLKQVKLA
ncbi:MAG: MFS transporter [Patescibacteria group bacterium]